MTNNKVTLSRLIVRGRAMLVLSLLGLAAAFNALHAQQGTEASMASGNPGSGPVIREEVSRLLTQVRSCMSEENADCTREALDEVSRISLNPWEAAQASNFRGSVELSSGNALLAAAAYENALGTSNLPSGLHRRVLITLARLYIQTGQQERALEALNEVSEVTASTAVPRSALRPNGEWLPILRIAPVYPVEAAAAGLEEGYVLVAFTITARGTVEDPRAVESSSVLFEEAALDAARKQRYLPRVIAGQPVAVDGVTTVFRFGLDDYLELATSRPPRPLSAENAPAAEPGPYDVVSEPAFGSPGFLVFRPADLHAFPDNDSLPVVAWANGGCARISTVFADFLSTVASHGFLVLTTAPVEPATRWYATVDDLRAALDWAEAEATREGSPLRGKIATDQMAAMGQSCGGQLAVGLGTDPRIDTTGVFNSDVFLSAIPGARRDTYVDLHGPVLLLNGHELDHAMAGSAASFDAIDRVPVFYGARYGAGHFGTFLHPGGGEFANVASNWLRFMLKGDAEAGKTFFGEDCGLCRNENWETRGKQIE